MIKKKADIARKKRLSCMQYDFDLGAINYSHCCTHSAHSSYLVLVALCSVHWNSMQLHAFVIFASPHKYGARCNMAINYINENKTQPIFLFPLNLTP